MTLIFGALAFSLAACSPVKMEPSGSTTTNNSLSGGTTDTGSGVGDGVPNTPPGGDGIPKVPPTPPPTTPPTASVPPTTPPTTTPPTTTTPPDIDSPAPADPASAAARCAQLQAQRPPLSNVVYGDVAGGVVREVFNGQSIGTIIAAIADVEAYANTIAEADLGASNTLLAAHTIGDVNAGFGAVYLIGDNAATPSTAHDVIAGAPATIVVCGMHVHSIAIGVGKLILVNSQVDDLLGAAITVVEVNSTVTKSTVGLLTIKR
jgi:hypothetical protein